MVIDHQRQPMLNRDFVWVSVTLPFVKGCHLSRWFHILEFRDHKQIFAQWVATVIILDFSPLAIAGGK